MNFDVKFGMEYRGGGSVQADWAQNDPEAKDYVKNRPGGYEIVDFDITWDGNLDGHEVIDASDCVKLVKVSDAVLAQEQLTGAYAEVIIDGEMSKVASLEVMRQDDLLGLINGTEGELALVALTTINADGIVLTPGVYFYCCERGGIATRTSRIAKSNIVKIPSKYIPGNPYVLDLYEDDDGELRARGSDVDAYRQAVLNGGAIYVMEAGDLAQVLPMAVDAQRASEISTQAIRLLASVVDADGWEYYIRPDAGKDPVVDKHPRQELMIEASDGTKGWLVVNKNEETGAYNVVFRK